MKTTEKTLKEIYNLGNQETKDKLEKEFPTLFEVKSMLRSAIDYLTEKDEEVVKLRKLETLDGIDNLLAEQKLIVIIKAKNEKHVFNWNNSNEYKYLPYFTGNEEDFRYFYYDAWARSTASSRLYLKSKELVEELVNNEEVSSLYKTYMKK